MIKDLKCEKEVFDQHIFVGVTVFLRRTNRASNTHLKLEVCVAFWFGSLFLVPVGSRKSGSDSSLSATTVLKRIGLPNTSNRGLVYLNGTGKAG